MDKNKIEIVKVNSDELNNKLKINPNRHNCYKYYSKKGTIEKILNNKCIFLSDGKKWNDLNDRKHFNDSKGVYRFGLCLSTFQSESVAMWMLYGGKGEDGALIDFTPTTIAKIIRKYKNKSIDIYNEKLVPLKSDVKIKDIYLYDVVYHSDDNRYFLAGKDEFIIKEKTGNNNIVALKDYQWHYEREARLILEVNKRDIKDILKCNGGLYIKIDLQDEINDFKKRVFIAPMYKRKTRYNKSKLYKTMSWKLD